MRTRGNVLTAPTRSRTATRGAQDDYGGFTPEQIDFLIDLATEAARELPDAWTIKRAGVNDLALVGLFA